MRFEVPQFIEVEDKIVGPLTWRQFIYIAGGTGILVVFYFSLPFILFAIFGLPLGALAGFLAFHRINNRPFSVFLESFVSYMRKGKLYLWRKDREQTVISYPESYTPTDSSVVEHTRSRISSLAQKLESHALEK